MEQPFLDNFLQAEAEARESLISKEERLLHLAKTALRYEKMQKVCKDPGVKRLLEKYKQETLKLMRTN